MKQKLIYLISIICLSLTLYSCDTAYYGVSSNPQYNDEEVLNNKINYNIIVQYGTPYYYDGYLNYYFYEGLYYYPVYYNKYWYFRTYRRPFRYGYFPDNRHWRPRPHMRGFNGFGRSDRFGRFHRNNGYGRRPIINRNQNRMPNPTHNGQNRRFDSLPPSRSNVNVQRQNRSNGTFGNGSRSGNSNVRNFGGRR